MSRILKGIPKFVVANLAVLVVIMMLPVFLVTDSVPLMDGIMDYLFNNESS
ncbi:hypothetical protein GCM10008983_13460 [Lentibacillus halophilus]|uniref:Uncharacterized protein n=1 Tax=Lentibacillus halophilus TaxID=295065 RepID=A0ABN0Z841_9BACI